MGAKIATRYAGAVCTVFVFLLVCGFDIPSSQAAWQIETVPCSRTPGLATLALDANSFPHIAVAADNYLMYAYKDVSGWHEETLRDYDSSGDELFLPIVEVDTQGYPHVFYATSYFEGMVGFRGDYFIASKTASGWDFFYVGWAGYNNLWPETYYAFALDSNDGKHSFMGRGAGMGWAVPYYDMEGFGGMCDPQLLSDLAMDSADYPHIFYRISDGNPVKYSYKDGTGWHTEIFESAGNTLGYLSIALDTNDIPHVSYYDNVNKDLKYAYRDAGGWHIETIDSSGDVGMYNSLGVDSQDRPHISYYDATNGDLKYARRDGSGWHIETVDSAGDVGLGSSLDMDSLDRPHILYQDQTNAALKYAAGSSGCQDDSGCSEGYACVDGTCAADQPPEFLSEPLWFGPWMGLSSDPANPHKPQSQHILFWAYDDDRLACTDGVEVGWKYRPVALQEGVVVALGDWIVKEPWRFLWFVWIEDPSIADIPGPGLFEFKMTATDCLDQEIDSEVFWSKRYYFQVD